MIERKMMIHAFDEAKHCEGSYDDFPTMVEGMDVDRNDFMVYLSRARVPQPCFMASEHDQVLLVLAGFGHLTLATPKQSELQLSVGDTVYLPAGVGSRIIPVEELLLLRYKAEPPGWEAAIWFCGACGAEVYQREFDAGQVVSQAGFWQACQDFNNDLALRTCPRCQTVHPEADLADIRWAEVAEFLSSDDKQQAADASSP